MSKKWFTNGIREIQVNEGNEIPSGYYSGRKPKTIEKEKLRLEKFTQTMNSKTEEEKELSNLKRSNSLKKTYAQKSEDEIAEIIKKRKSAMESKTEEEKNEYRNKISQNTKGKNKGKSAWNKGLTKETDERVKKCSEHTREINLLKVEYIKSNNPNYYKNWREKISLCMAKNKSFNTSKPEENLYKELCLKYGEENVIRQYYDAERYPYSCDFYIKTEDLFIELNATWTHGGKPYNAEDKECQEQLKLWEEKAKTSDFYRNAIYTWTDLDVRKQTCAKRNNLNYKIIY